MSLDIYLIDINETMCDAWSHHRFPPRVKIVHGSILELPVTGVNVFVSPANSLGLMRGGIDSVYQKMFPSIESDVRETIRYLGFKSANGDYFLPVGSALLVKVSGEPTLEHLKGSENYFIVCPSMILPGTNIEKTNNVIHCYRSIFGLIRKMDVKVDNILIPGIGTGIGGVSAERCANNTYQALLEGQCHDESKDSQHLVLNTAVLKQQQNTPQHQPYLKYSIDKRHTQ